MNATPTPSINTHSSSSATRSYSTVGEEGAPKGKGLNGPLRPIWSPTNYFSKTRQGQPGQPDQHSTSQSQLPSTRINSVEGNKQRTMSMSRGGKPQSLTEGISIENPLNTKDSSTILTNASASLASYTSTKSLSRYTNIKNHHKKLPSFDDALIQNTEKNILDRRKSQTRGDYDHLDSSINTVDNNNNINMNNYFDNNTAAKTNTNAMKNGMAFRRSSSKHPLGPPPLSASATHHSFSNSDPNSSNNTTFGSSHSPHFSSSSYSIPFSSPSSSPGTTISNYSVSSSDTGSGSSIYSLSSNDTEKKLAPVKVPPNYFRKNSSSSKDNNKEVADLPTTDFQKMTMTSSSSLSSSPRSDRSHNESSRRKSSALKSAITHIIDKVSSPSSNNNNKNSTGTHLYSMETSSTKNNANTNIITLSIRPKSVVGLNNLGNTCFMNSVLQCLLWSPGLIPYFVENLIQDTSTSSFTFSSRNIICDTSPLKGNLAKAFSSLLKQCTNENSGGSVSPQTLKKMIAKWAPQFLGYEQHDSQEFMHYLLDGLGEDLNRNSNEERMKMRKLNEAEALAPDIVKEKWDIGKLADDAWYRYSLGNASIITDLFTGQLLSKLECMECGYVSYCIDPFLDVSLPIPKQTPGASDTTTSRGGVTGAGYTTSNSTIANSYSDYRRRSSLSTSPSQVDLESCFRHFNSKEILDDDEKVKCVRCQVRQRTYKTLYLHRLPSLLVVHIKRFSAFGYRRRKLDTTITDFETVNVSPFLHETSKKSNKGSTVYDLYGVSNHMGSLGGGHYTANCKVPQGSCGSTVIRKGSSASISHVRRQSSLSGKESEWYLFDDSRTSPTSTLSGSAAYLLFYQKRNK